MYESRNDVHIVETERPFSCHDLIAFAMVIVLEIQLAGLKLRTGDLFLVIHRWCGIK